MIDSCPPSRRTFYHEWDAIDYYYNKALFWFYRRHDRQRAMTFCRRLEKYLRTSASCHEAVLGEAAWSLVYEVRGDLRKAIAYRLSEIKLIRRLWANTPGPPGKDYGTKNYGPSDLSDRYDLLAMLYRKAGHLDKALEVLEDSKQLCREYGIRFDGRDLVRDIEYEASKSPNGRHRIQGRKPKRTMKSFFTT